MNHLQLILIVEVQYILRLVFKYFNNYINIKIYIYIKSIIFIKLIYIYKIKKNLF